MTRTRMSRRTMLKGATALGALVAASGELLAQQTVSRSAGGPAAPLPPRGEFVIRGATVLTMDPNIGDFATGDVHVRDGAIVAVAPRIDLTNVQIIEGRGMICMPGFVDTHWHLWTSLLPAVRQGRRQRARLLPGEQPPGPALHARGQLPQRDARHSRSVERRCDDGAQLGAQCQESGSRRRRALRHARCGHPWTVRLRSRAGDAGRSADGHRWPCAREARLDAGGRSAHARHLLAQRRRHEHRRRDARDAHDRHDEAGLGRRTCAGAADHAAHLRPEPDQAARGGRAARPRRAARAPAAHHARGARDPEGARRQLRDGPRGRGAPSVQRRCHPARRVAGGGRQGQSVDRPHHQLQLRSLRRHAHSVRAASAPHRQQDTRSR